MILACLLAAVHPCSADDGVAESIRKAWLDRTASSPRIKVTWVAKVFHPRGAYDDLVAIDREPKNPEAPAGPYPPDDIHTTHSWTLWIDGGRSRIEADQPMFSDRDRTLREYRFAVTHDGEIESHLDLQSNGQVPTGFISKNKRNGFLQPPTEPICQFFRGDNPRFYAQPELTDCQIQPDPSMPRAIIATYKEGDSGGTRRRGFDSSNGFSMLWSEYVKRTGEVVNRCTVREYSNVAGFRLPWKWTCLAFSKRKLMRQTDCELVSVEKLTEHDHIEIPLVFPKGTYVSDVSVQGVKNEYVVTDDKPIPVKPWDARQVAEAVARGELVGSAQSKWYSNMWVWIAIGALILAVSAFIKRRYARSHHPSGAVI